MKTNDVLAGLLGVLVGALFTLSLRRKASPKRFGNLVVLGVR